MQALIDGIANLLRVPGEILRDFSLMIPLGVARSFFILYFLILIFWVLTMDHKEVKGNVPGVKKVIDLRPYVALVLGGQILIYLIF